MMTLLALSAWLGLLCAVSPCFLAANIAAVGFLAQNCQSRRKVLLAGILYALGRVSAYVAVGALLSAGMTAAPGLSHFLQKYMTLLMGPLLVLVSSRCWIWWPFPGRTAKAGDWRDALPPMAERWEPFSSGLCLPWLSAPPPPPSSLVSSCP